MKKENLGDLCDIVIGRTPSRKIAEYWGTGYPWVSISDLKEKYIEHTKEEITQAAIEKVRCRLIPRGTLLFSFKLSIGKMAFAVRDLYTNEAIAALIIKDSKSLLPNYLFFALKVARLLGSNQAAMGKTLNSKSLALIKVPVPDDPDDQIRIATLLSRVEALIATRKDNLHLLDEFLKSTFLEMFGDPVRNEKDWETERLGNLAKVERGRFSPRPRNDPKFYNGDFPFIQTGDISRSNGRLHNYSQTLNEFGIKVSKEFKKDTIVIAIVGATIGETAVLQIDTYAPDSVIGITPTSKAVDSIYLEFLLRFWKPVLKARAPEAARANININTLKPLGIILPSEDLVANFVFAAKKVESLKTLYQQSLSELENLYGVLSQKAFKGELDLSRIPLEKVPEETVLDAAPETADQFPEPDSYAMSDPAAREKLLRQLFDDFIAERKGQTFSMEIFWTQAEQKVLEHMDDEDLPIGVADWSC